MKHYLGPLVCVCALVAACSKDQRPAESGYRSSSETDPELVPASSDAVTADEPSRQPSQALDTGPDTSEPAAPDTIPPPADESRQASPNDATPVPPDNTSVNRRDSEGASPTPTDQGNNSADLRITQEIRDRIAEAARQIAGASNVDNQLEVVK